MLEARGPIGLARGIAAHQALPQGRRLPVVGGAQLAQIGLQLGRQRGEGRGHAGPHGVAARGRHVHGVEAGTGGRLGLPGQVGMPDVGAGARALADQQLDMGIVRVRGKGGGHGLDLAEHLGHAHLLRRVQRLVAEEDDLALGQQPAQRVRMVMHLRRVREIDAVYLRSYARGDVFDLHEIPFLKKSRGWGGDQVDAMSCGSGMERNRRPVAWNRAVATAGAVGPRATSPQPWGGRSLSTRTTSTRGISDSCSSG